MYILKPKFVLIYINLNNLYLLIHLFYVLYTTSIRHVGISTIEIQYYYYIIIVYDDFSQFDCYLPAFECVADDNGVAATAAVSNMLDHLRSISALWRDVLPTNTYCRAIGGFTLCSVPINILFQSFLVIV